MLINKKVKNVINIKFYDYFISFSEYEKINTAKEEIKNVLYKKVGESCNIIIKVDNKILNSNSYLKPKCQYMVECIINFQLLTEKKYPINLQQSYSETVLNVKKNIMSMVIHKEVPPDNIILKGKNGKEIKDDDKPLIEFGRCFDLVINDDIQKQPKIKIKASTEKNPVNTKVSDFKFIDAKSIEELLKVKKRIGSGATSTVYKVKDIFNGKGYLAIKILNKLFFQLMKPNSVDGIKFKKDFWNDDDDKEEEEEDELYNEDVQRLFKEWELLSQFDHPNIIKTYGFFIGDKTHSPSIVLEYCKCNLEEAIFHLENIDLVKVVYQICKAMQYLHDNKVIHRDLKIKNILLNAQKNVKICDFGISKLIDNTNFSTMTHNIGTFIYMAPELFNNESKIDEKIDVYAFGVVLYFIVTKGKLPVFDQNNPLENHKIPGNVNKNSQSIIKKCWSFSPKNRPSFKSIIDTVVSNNFHLFNDVNESIYSLGF